MIQRNIFIGFDGFVDTLVRAVDYYDGDRKIYINSIEQFGRRISSAAGKSTNIELDIICKKIGGNGPILSDALRVLGAHTTYIGTLNNNIFEEFIHTNHAFSIGLPGETRALEFEDGKILLGEMYDTVNIDADRVCSVCNKQILRDIISENELLCFVNWTMLLKLHSIFDLFLDEIIDKNKRHHFFFDLADPSKRKKQEMIELIGYIQKFSKIGKTILGLNLREADYVSSVLEYPHKIVETKDSMMHCARFIHDRIGCDTVFIHANTISAGFDGGSIFVTGYFSQYPKISTGAGDHFNAGFLFDYLEQNDIESALHMGSAVSKYYVDNACSPTYEQAKVIVARK